MQSMLASSMLRVQTWRAWDVACADVTCLGLLEMTLQ